MRAQSAIAILLLATIAGCAANPLGFLRGEKAVPVVDYAAAFAAPELGIITDENRRVVDIEPRGAAAQGGVQVGDILLSIAPAPELPPSEEPASTLLSEAAPDDTIIVEIDNNGQPISPLASIEATPMNITSEEAAAIEATAELAEMESGAYELVPGATNVLPPGADITGKLTETVFFDNRPNVKQVIAFDNPPNRMIIKVLRGDTEIELEVTPGPRGKYRTPDATPTPVLPPYDYY